MRIYVSSKEGTAIYVTAQDRRQRTSKTITVRGESLTPEAVIKAIKEALAHPRRKAG